MDKKARLNEVIGKGFAITIADLKKSKAFRLLCIKCQQLRSK